MAIETSGPRHAKDPKDSGDLSPEAHETITPRPAAPSLKVHNLETHDLTAREQIMRQWPTWDWETRDES